MNYCILYLFQFNDTEGQCLLTPEGKKGWAKYMMHHFSTGGELQMSEKERIKV